MPVRHGAQVCISFGLALLYRAAIAVILHVFAVALWSKLWSGFYSTNEVQGKTPLFFPVDFLYWIAVMLICHVISASTLI